MTTSASQAQEGVFRSYEEMRSSLVNLLKTRQIRELMVVFGGADEQTPQELDNLEAQVRQLYPQDFRDAHTIRRVDLDNGWSQELIAFRTGMSYIFAYVVLHQRDDALVAVNFRFNSDFNKLNTLF